MSVQESGFDQLLATGVNHLHRFRRLSKIRLAAGGIVKENRRPEPGPFGSADLSEEGCQPPELILAPLLIGVVVTLGAIQPSSQEDPHLFRHDIRGLGFFPVGKKVSRSSAVALCR